MFLQLWCTITLREKGFEERYFNELQPVCGLAVSLKQEPQSDYSEQYKSYDLIREFTCNNSLMYGSDKQYSFPIFRVPKMKNTHQADMLNKKAKIGPCDKNEPLP